MKFILEKSALLKDIVTCLKEFTNATSFVFDASGLHLQCMDSAHVSMVELHLSSDKFKVYECDAPVSLGVSLQNLSQLMRLATPKTAMSWDYAPGADVVCVQLAQPENGSNYSFKMVLMDLEMEGLEVPDNLEYTHVVSMKSGEFKKLTNDMLSFGEDVEMTCSSDELLLKVRGNAGELTVSKNVELVEVTSSCRGRFSGKYLLMLCNAERFSTTMTLSLKDMHPLKLHYDLGGGTSYLTAFVAPRIYDEGDI